MPQASETGSTSPDPGSSTGAIGTSGTAESDRPLAPVPSANLRRMTDAPALLSDIERDLGNDAAADVYDARWHEALAEIHSRLR